MAGKVIAWARAHAGTIAGVSSLFERQVQVFPIAVTALASAAFLFGGRCAAWQWWVCVAGTLTWGFAHGRRGLAAGGLFVGLLAFLWVAAGVFVTTGWMDTLTYHLPAIRLLTEGWNPVLAGTPEALAATMGVDPWEMRQWHVLAMPKTVWVFNAVVQTFTRTPLNLLYPLWPFLFLTAAAQLWRLPQSPSPWPRVLAVVLLWALCTPPTSSMVDAAVTLGAVGTLAGMGRALGGERPDWAALAAHSFWLATAKQVGLFACFVFWMVFAVAWLWQRRGEWPRAMGALAGVAATLGVLLCLTCASPYLTMWRAYGHPFYPKYTVDPEAYPVRDITHDFLEQNEDARAMGRLGAFVNAYVSQSLAQTYYKWKLGQETFAPRASTWNQGGDDGFESAGPTSWADRLLFVAVVAFVLLMGGARERLLAGMALAVLLALPVPMIGYLRYTPWLFPLLLPLAVCAACRVRPPWPRRVLLAALALAFAPRIMQLALQRVAAIDTAYALQATLDAAPPKRVYAYYSGGLDIRSEKDFRREISGDPRRTALCNLRLLCRQEPRLRDAEILAQSDFSPIWKTYPTFFHNAEFKVEPGTVWPVSPLFIENSHLPNRWRRLLNYPFIVLRVLGCRLPALVARRVTGTMRLRE